MALQLSKTGIAQTQIINAWHVTQSIDAFSGLFAYDILLSGSFTLTGSQKVNGSISASMPIGFVGTASWAINSLTASFATSVLSSSIQSIEGAAVLSGSNFSAPFPLRFIAGYGIIPSGSLNVNLTITPLLGKILGANVFVSVGLMSSFVSSSIDYYPRINTLIADQLQFSVPSASNAPIEFHFTIMHY